jgi:hypothetical protein
VRPTLHGRSRASVDYYRTVTGPGKEEVREDLRTGESVRIFRVESVAALVTCSDCWPLPAVQAELLELRRSGLPGRG